MKKRKALLPLSAGLGFLLGGLLVYILGIRNWLLKWGATPEELNAGLPGDDLLSSPGYRTTRAITIHAPAAQVWPWLVQIGYGRAGWYSYDQLEEAAGAGDFMEGQSTRRIIPELQELKIGDAIPAAPPPYLAFHVQDLQAARYLVTRCTIDMFSGHDLGVGNRRGNYLDGTWVFFLHETGPHTTRMVFRLRAEYPATPLMGAMVRGVLEPVHFLMEQKMMRGIRERAESM
ncbi:MAG: hypothetical protein VB089_03630 [Anaerolineaceae bacterium]|jgi:hypothetical protein|nr:hypothetical protein [Anaerolineaceae bacterium]